MQFCRNNKFFSDKKSVNSFIGKFYAENINQVLS